MNILLIFFALPVATIILSIVLQKVLNNPLLVAATFFAIYLIVTFAFFDASFLVYAILYTILAYVTAVLTRAICNLIKVFQNNCTYRITERPLALVNANLTNGSNGVSSNINTTNNSNINTANNLNENTITGCCNCRRIRR